MLDGFIFLLYFFLCIITYPLRYYHKHKGKKSGYKHKCGVLYLLKEKPCANLEYDYGEESTAEIDLEDEND